MYVKPFNDLASLCIVLVTFIISSCSADLYSCGGFVKSSSAPIDYSKIQVRLLTSEGNLKYETECNPSNGYYMIPVYSKAAYSIRVYAPEGWFFEPSSFNLKVDGKTDACTKGEDINFLLSSFAVEGVLRSGESDGPSGVSLTLSKDDGTVIAETKTTVGGAYKFHAPPGKYLVSTANGSTECIERGRVATEIITGPVHVSPDLKISGHLLTVFTFLKGQPLSGIAITIRAKHSVELPYCLESKSSKIAEIDQSDHLSICTLTTDASGKALFPCLPTGSYVVVPSLVTEKVQFSFEPKYMMLDMRFTAENVSFEMRGFTSKGRVMLGIHPVAMVDIIVNGVKKATSDQEGWYSLDALQEQEYAITAAAPNFEFSKITAKLSVQKPEIEDILVKSVQLCGLVEVSEGSNYVMAIIIVNKRTKDSVSVRSDGTGKFCKFLSPGVYVVSASSDNSVVMTPKERIIDITSGPALDVVFTQFKANLHATVFCIARCDKLVVELWQGQSMISSKEGFNRFHFEGVSPRIYTMKIIDNGSFCWEKTEIRIVVERSDINDIEFHQNGFKASVHLSHPGKLNWFVTNKKQLRGEVVVPSGFSVFCVPVAGHYTITLEACHVFDKSSYEMRIPQDSALVAKATKFLTTTTISSNDRDAKANHFTMHVKTDNTEFSSPVSSSEGRNFYFTFYIPASDFGSSIILKPVSNIHLFTPAEYAFKFNGECHSAKTPFVADKGVFIEGTLKPALEGAIIRVHNKIDSQLLFTTQSDAEGLFRIGPMRSFEDIEIYAEKEGYKFEKTEKFAVLNTIKLSQLRISAIDVATQLPLPGVLISLSGAEDYRSNSMINETGFVKFVGLKPGDYFIRPILQEYRFEPSSSIVVVNDGEEQDVRLYGKRFAYSVLGKVAQLSGQPVSGLMVEAVSEQCSQLQEEDTTSAKGEYRIRGLHPGCVYRLTLKSSNGAKVQSYPSHYDISVQSENVEEINFFLTHIEKQLDVFGNVEFVGVKPPTQYRIGLYRDDIAIQQTVVNSPSTVFFFGNLSIDNKEYNIRFEAVHGNGGQKLDSSEVAFIANRSFKAVAIVVRQQKKSSDVEISSGNYLAFPFFIFVAIIFFNHQKALSLVESTVGHVSSLAASHRSCSPSDDHSEILRRRQRAKKA